MLAIPHEQLSDDALAAVIEAFVLREGTDYGTESFSLADKCAQVRAAVLRGEVTLCFDSATESTTLIPTLDLPEAARLPAVVRSRAGRPLRRLRRALRAGQRRCSVNTRSRSRTTKNHKPRA